MILLTLLTFLPSRVLNADSLTRSCFIAPLLDSVRAKFHCCLQMTLPTFEHLPPDTSASKISNLMVSPALHQKFLSDSFRPDPLAHSYLELKRLCPPAERLNAARLISQPSSHALNPMKAKLSVLPFAWSDGSDNIQRFHKLSFHQLRER